MGEVHDFRAQLRFSQQSSCEGFWDAVYRKAFPDMEWHRACIENTTGQRLGIDRLVYLQSGRVLSVDEKKRRVFRSDIALETISNSTSRSLGWMNKDLQIDFLAYAFMDRRLVYLFPWPMLRRAWLHYRKRWAEMATRKAKGFRWIKAHNHGYDTICLCVPIRVLLRAVSLASIIELDPMFKEAAQ